jgi:putative transposase
MVTPAARRRAARHLAAAKRYSVRLACKTAGLERSTYYYKPKQREEEERLVEELHRLSRKHPRYGYELMTGKLRQGGWRVNEKRVQRIWRQEGLRVVKKRHKRRRLSGSTVVRQAALYPNHVWSWDFVFDRSEDGRSLKILNIVDEYSRYSIALQVRRHFTAGDVMQVLGQAMLEYGIPGCIRSDNGGEFVGAKVKEWLAENGIGIMYIEPGSPWENPYVESFNGRLREEKLNRELFSHVLEAKVVLSDWRREYNEERPHGLLRRRTPKEVYEQRITPCPLREQGVMQAKTTSTGREYFH